MGTGKSTVAALLADRLGLEWIDTDALIEHRHGPIPDIFRDHGEREFRRLERELAEELAGRAGVVVSTGGGFMLDDANARLLADAAVFCLTADVDTILTRVDRQGDHRPLLAADDRRARIEGLLAARAGGYARFEQVSTDDRSPDEIVADIVARLDAATT